MPWGCSRPRTIRFLCQVCRGAWLANFLYMDFVYIVLGHAWPYHRNHKSLCSDFTVIFAEPNSGDFVQIPQFRVSSCFRSVDPSPASSCPWHAAPSSSHWRLFAPRCGTRVAQIFDFQIGLVCLDFGCFPYIKHIHVDPCRFLNDSLQYRWIWRLRRAKWSNSRLVQSNSQPDLHRPWHQYPAASPDLAMRHATSFSRATALDSRHFACGHYWSSEWCVL